MSLPTVAATGRLTADPELRFTAQGKAVAKFTVACNSRRKNAQTGEWEDGDRIFLPVDLWENAAEEAAEHLRKGDLVHLTGSLRQREYTTQDGETRRVVEVVYGQVYRALPRLAVRTGSDDPGALGARDTAEDVNDVPF